MAVYEENKYILFWMLTDAQSEIQMPITKYQNTQIKLSISFNFLGMSPRYDSKYE